MAQLDFLTTPTPVHIHMPDMDIPLKPEAAPAPKAEGAYKTIREVSEEIDVPQHVLRFWESRFPQIKPSRMRGSRRYYRPEDVNTLKTIKTLLYSKGYTIKGAKKVVGGKEEMPPMSPVAATAAPVQRAVTAASTTVPQSTSVKKAAPKGVDKQVLVSELRALKSMLAGLI